MYLKDVSSFAYVCDIDEFGKLQDMKNKENMEKHKNTIIRNDTAYIHHK